MSKTLPQIVILDAGSVDFDDISLKGFQKFGKVKAYHQTAPSQLVARAKNASVIVTNKFRLFEPQFKQLPHLKLICIAATGTNNVDLKVAQKYGVGVANVAGYSTESVVQFTISFILALASGLREMDINARKGAWSRSEFFTLPTSFNEVQGKCLGILGYGTIGKRVGQVAKSLGMKVLVGKIPGRKYAGAQSKKRVTLAKLLGESDFLTIHTPLSPLTQDLIDEAAIRRMRPDSFLINMARGGIVNEKSLLKALRTKRLAGAALDVLEQEPPARNNPLLKAPRLLMTPHAAWASVESRQRLVKEMVLNIEAFLKGRRRNRVV